MKDIFISYASEDRAIARSLAAVLVRRGWSVWWDRTILPGATYEEVIEEALDSAACVIVLWSKKSVISDWVKNEAAEATRRKILIPVSISPCKVPLQFRHLQTADLRNWRTKTKSSEFTVLLKALGNIIGRTSQAPKRGAKTATRARKTRGPQNGQFGKSLSTLIEFASKKFKGLKGKQNYRTDDGYKSYQSTFSLPGSTHNSIWVTPKGEYYFACEFISGVTQAKAKAVFDAKVETLQSSLPKDWVIKMRTQTDGLIVKELSAVNRKRKLRLELTFWSYGKGDYEVDFFIYA